MKMRREWAMPNGNTFEIKPIRSFVLKYITDNQKSIDPFANSCKIATITNDIDPQFKTDYNLDAIDFLRQFESNSIDLILFDPPYSPRQVSEIYKSLDLTVNMETTQSRFWSQCKREIGRILKNGGFVLSFGWNSNGIGVNQGFSIEEILLVAHGGQHNDTICIAEQKKRYRLF